MTDWGAEHKFDHLLTRSQVLNLHDFNYIKVEDIDMKGVNPSGFFFDEDIDRPKTPPRFESQVDADAWLAVNDVPRQLYPTGSLVAWDRRCEWVLSSSGVAVPYGDIEFVGKVVSWKPTWRLATHDSQIPYYQLLTNAWESNEPELVWVAAHEIKGPA